MTGVSVGYFDPALFNVDPDSLARGIRRVMRIRNRSWPLAVSSIMRSGYGTGVAYAMVDGHIPMHIDTKGLEDWDGKLFQFVLEVENRPLLSVVEQNPDLDPHVLGTAEDRKPFKMGAVELIAGRAVHFDITTHWHGVSSLPMPARSIAANHTPRAIIIQVAGFEAEQIEQAISFAAPLIQADRAFWSSARKMRKAR